MMKLTAREKEILDVLKKEPLIAQDDLANRLGISRSSIAVHISNLMKKGFILGKGYVFNEQIFVAVLGELCWEVRVHKESGAIDIGKGGFAYKTSKALAKFGIQVKLLSLIGGDAIGAELIAELKDYDIDVSHVYHYSQKRTCRKLYFDEVLNLREDFSLEEYQKAAKGLKWIAINSEWLLIDNHYQFFIDHDNIEIDLFSCPRLCMAENMKYPDPIPQQLNRYYLVVLGVESLEAMDYYVRKGQNLVLKGLTNLIITDGINDIIIMAPHERILIPLTPSQKFDVHVNLDLFLAGLIFGLSSGYQIRQAARIAAGTANTV